MNLKPWEATIQQIADESSQQRNERTRDGVLIDWRQKLAKEPTSLGLHHIDEIMREVRKRLTIASRSSAA